MTLVMKFGGTSVGSAKAMRETAVLITDAKVEWGSVAVIASAMGSKPIKVTDLLLNGAHAVANGDNETYKTNATLIRQIHQETIAGLLTDERDTIIEENGRFIDQFESLCQAMSILGELSPRALDTIGRYGGTHECAHFGRLSS